jgi:hypothetical protein
VRSGTFFIFPRLLNVDDFCLSLCASFFIRFQVNSFFESSFFNIFYFKFSKKIKNSNSNRSVFVELRRFFNIHKTDQFLSAFAINGCSTSRCGG